MQPQQRRLLSCLLCLLILVGGSFVRAANLSNIGIKTVFVILMENHDWSTVKGSPNCPYINNTLLPQASYANQYYTPPANHPSEPNYIWLEAGTNFGILDDSPNNRINSTNHLVSLLNRAGISWKTYQESIDGWYCPGTNKYPYVVRHNPMVLFKDVSSNVSFCTNHMRPYSELAADLQNNTVARYNFITPNLTNDMHELATNSAITSTRILGDQWLSREVPKILGSPAFTNGGVLIITWDEGSEPAGGPTSDGPIGLIVLSPLAKGGGYNNNIRYTHSSLLRSVQDIFNVRPYLADAANAKDLGDLFITMNLTAPAWTTNDQFQFKLTGLVPGKTSVIQSSTDLLSWTSISTNVFLTSITNFFDAASDPADQRFYRVIQLAAPPVVITLASAMWLTNHQFQFTAVGVSSGKTNIIEASADLASWTPISTNRVFTNRFTFTDTRATNYPRRFYRVFQRP